MLMSGSIAAAKASGVISALVKQGHAVKVVTSRSLPNFVGTATLEGLSGQPVYHDAFTAGEVMQHIHLSRWADCLLLCPASANAINKIAHGIADDMLSTVWMAGQGLGKPMWVVPAMNRLMWQHPATQRSVQLLQSWGVQFMPVGRGELACGEHGEGRMAEVDDVVAAVLGQGIEARPVQTPQRILITAGGTREYIDGVRYIGNLSSGRTGAAMAERLHMAGHRVVWLGAEDARVPRCDCEKIRYSDFSSLEHTLKQRLGDAHFDAVIHAAAVSDYSVQAVHADGQAMLPGRDHKIASQAGHLQLTLKKNPKLVDRLAGWSRNPSIRVLAFKLTHNADASARRAAVETLIARAGVHWVAHNDLSEIHSDQHPFTLYHGLDSTRPCAGVDELTDHFLHHLERCA